MTAEKYLNISETTLNGITSNGKFLNAEEPFILDMK